MTDTQEYVVTEGSSLARLKSDLKTWAADVAAGRRVDSPVGRAKVELRVSELELAEAVAKVTELTERLETGAGQAVSASTLATAKGVAEHASGVVKGKSAALARAKNAERIAKLTALGAELVEYAQGDMVPAIATELEAAVRHLNTYQELIASHNAYIYGVAEEARRLGVCTADGPGQPDPATGGISLVPDSGTKLRAGKYQVRTLDQVSLFTRAKGEEGPEKVAEGIRENVNRPAPDPSNVYYRSGDGGSVGYPQGSEPGPVQASLRNLVEISYSDVWPAA